MNLESRSLTEVPAEERLFFISPREKRMFYPKNQVPAVIEALYTQTSPAGDEYATNTTAWD